MPLPILFRQAVLLIWCPWIHFSPGTSMPLLTLSPQVQKALNALLYLASLPNLLASSQSAHKTEFTCHLPWEPLLISPGWVRGFYFFSISVQIFHWSVPTSMLTAPVVRDCVFSLLDSQYQAHNRNFIYILREQFSCVGRWDHSLAQSQC